MASQLMTADEAGFEVVGGWAFQFTAARTTDAARTGSYSLRTRSPAWAGWESLSVFPVGTVVVFGAWVRLESGGGATLQVVSGISPTVQAFIDIESDGSILYKDAGGMVIRTDQAPNPSDWFRVLSSWVVVDPGAPIFYVFEETQSETLWLIDDVTFQDGNMITKEIYDDAVLDLQAINGTGIFTTAFDAVYSEPQTHQLRLNRTVEISPQAGGEDDALSVGDRARGGSQNYGIKVVIRSQAPRADIQTAIDDVRNALQRSTSNIKSAKTAGTVEDVTLTWDEPLTSDDIHSKVAEASLTLTVTYTFTAGAA